MSGLVALTPLTLGRGLGSVQKRMKTIITTNKDIHQHFEGFLVEQGLRVTTQRSQILDTFLCMGDHVSAEELYREVMEHYPGIGQATVFRTMKLIAAAGIASEMSTRDRTVRYEHAVGGEHHDHLHCVACGRVLEFRSREVAELLQGICRAKGMRFVRQQINLYGYCESCSGT